MTTQLTKQKGLAICLAASQAIIIIFLLSWLLQHTPAVYAADWNVNTFADATDGDCDDGTCSLRDAVALSAPLDTIYLPAGSYVLTLGEMSVGKTITLMGQGATAADTVIDGNNASRLFNITSGMVTFTNLTLQNGQPASGNGGAIGTAGVGSLTLDNTVITNSISPGSGGGVFLTGGTLTLLNNSQILSNTAVINATGAGGGIYVNQGTVNLTDSIIAGNSARFGGGISMNQAAAQVIINNSQILNNSGLEPGPNGFPGGGIFIGTGSVIMNSGLISGNNAFRGAGVLVASGSFTLNGGSITDNESDYGAGVYVRNPPGLLTLNDGEISGNRSVATSFGGGGVYIFQGRVVQNGGEINDNTAVNFGGAMEVRQGSFEMNGGIISGNSAGNWGGAIYNDIGTITITNGTLTDNYSLLGGGAIATGATSHNFISNSVIYTNSTSITQTGGGILNTGTLTLTNVTLSDNLANNGGGLQNEGTATLTNVTIYENTAVSNGGGLNENGGTLNVVNSIIAGNSATTSGPDCAGTIVSQGYNLIQDDTDCTISGSTTGNISGDPLLTPLALNGGSTLNHALSSSSPALDAGDNGSCASTDQRGIMRPIDGDNDATATCDMGAFEYGIQIEIGDATVTEGDSGTTAATFIVTRSLQTSGTDSVEYATITNTATTADFTAVPSTTLTFNPGDITKTISIDVTGDTVDETDEIFFVQLGNPSTGLFISRDRGTGTIVDDDGEPSLSIADTIVSEGDGGTKTATFTVTLSTASAANVTVNYATSDETAVAPSDYLSTTNMLTFTPGDTEEIISITINGETTDENDETFLVTLSNPSNATLNDATAQGTITNDDTSPSLSIADSSVTEGDSGTTSATFTVTLSAVSGKAIGVDFATANDTAVAPVDYITNSDSLSFSPGDTEEIINITVNGDLTDEDAETFFVNLSGGSNATIADGQAVGTINDDDDPPAISINDIIVSEGDSGSSDATFTVSLDQASSKTITVDYETLADSATAGTDYTIASDTITFTPGSDSETITISITGDTIDEDDETFFVNLSNETNATIADSQGEATIIDDDVPPTISIDDVSVMEGDSGTDTAVFTVSLSHASSKTIMVAVDSSNGTAMAGEDYTAVSDTLAFNPGGLLSQTISVTIHGDETSEDDETFLLTLSSPSNATLGDSQAIGTIINDDGVFVYLPFIISP